MICRILGDRFPPNTKASREPCPDAGFGTPSRVRRTPRGLAVAATGMTAALAIGLGAGSAFGYFTTSGVGQGSASTASMLPVTGAAATPTTLLVPGGTAGVTLSLTNPNAFPITVVGASSAGPVLVDGSHMGCLPTSVAFIDQSGSLLHLRGNETATLTLNAAASMSDSAPDACQGASFTIPLFITARTS